MTRIHDRYFYSVEEANGRKTVHLLGNVYRNDADKTEDCFRAAEWSGVYLDICRVRQMFADDSFYECINNIVDYIDDMTEEEAENICAAYFNGSGGGELHISQVSHDTPCGDYWFEAGR